MSINYLNEINKMTKLNEIDENWNFFEKKKIKL